MKVLLRASGIVAMICLVLSLSLGERAQVATNQAAITWMYGTVQVRHATAGWTAATLNELLKPGDAVKTGADSRAELSLGRGGYVRMDEDSHLLITYLQADGLSSFKALVGGLWVTIESALTGSSKFQVQMPSAVASVKGTVFRCQVDEDGSSSTYVYEGEVEVEAEADGERLKLAPSQSARVRPGVKLALQRMLLDEDDENAWVKCNRHRDILRHLGNPKIMVALTEDGVAGEEGTYLCSQMLASTLRRHGFTETCISRADAAKFAVGENGWIRWRQRTDADYFVVGPVAAVPDKRFDSGLVSARAQAAVHLIDATERRSILKLTAIGPGIGETEREALAHSLRALGQRLGEELAPRIVRELMAEREGALRVDLSGVTSREQVTALRKIINQVDGTVRAAPLPLPGGRISLAVAGPMEPKALAATIREKASDLVQQVRVFDRVIYVKLKAASGQQPPQGEGQAGAPGRPKNPRPRRLRPQN